MNGMHQEDLLSESAIRRALRLETAELPPRLDAVALLARAQRRSTLERIQRAVRGAVLVGGSLAIEAAIGLVAFNTLADLDLNGPASVALSIGAAVAQRVVGLGALTADPSVAVAALAAILFAIAYERGSGKEPQVVRAS